ncbi:hypothetical protein BABA_13982 [Neobacillus bataviensis LMG 21833]|uniref:Uncharacterized protein n=1 Tax=Neobacillus bataviensis LMG 21833 TaxID=1117379 RepID=K6DG16_9BACI|nr:hypothetical protein [Neobacillus bataviensis]EKN67003.1 hypothetical protein BABA_13982 [Neobacillus bataviensis LMG 21833]
MDKHLKQTFEINFLKIGIIANAGVIQLGVGSGHKPRLPHAGYTQIGTSLVHLMSSAPSVPLASPVRRN